MDAKEFEGMSKAQAQKFTAYLENEYRALYPPPEMKIVGLGWKFYAIVATSIFTVILASLRTAQMFYSAAMTSAIVWGLGDSFTKWLSYGDALSSMFAVEAGLVVISAIKNSTKDDVPEWVYEYQIMILLVISVIAGFGQGIGLIKGLSADFLQAFSYILVFVLGIGASFAAWFSGEILGAQLQKYSVLRRDAEEVFSEHQRIYLQNARKFWSQRTEQEKSEKRMELLLGKGSPGEQKSRTEPSQRTPVRRTSQGVSEKVSIIIAELEKARTSGKLLSFAELAKVLRETYPEQNFSSNGYISAQRNKWIAEHPEYFEDK